MLRSVLNAHRLVNSITICATAAGLERAANVHCVVRSPTMYTRLLGRDALPAITSQQEAYLTSTPTHMWSSEEILGTRHPTCLLGGAE